jgi:uncharacterized Zn-finger protein
VLICPNCAKFLEDAAKLKNLCQDSEKFYFTSLSNKARTENNENFIDNSVANAADDSDAMEQHQIPEEDSLELEEFKFQDEHNENVTTTKSESKKKEPKSNIDEAKFSCTICFKKFARNDSLQRHQIVHSGKVIKMKCTFILQK